MPSSRLIAILILLISNTAVYAEPDVPSGLAHATAIFDQRAVTIIIPLDEHSWGRVVTLDESAGLAAAKAFALLDFVELPEKPEPGAFGVVVPREKELPPWELDYVVWPAEELNSDEYLLLPCFIEPTEPPYGFPRSEAAERLQDQVRRSRLGNIAVSVAADQQCIVIHDASELMKTFIEHRPETIEVYVNLRELGLQRRRISVVYKVPVNQAIPAPSLH